MRKQRLQTARAIGDNAADIAKAEESRLTLIAEEQQPAFYGYVWEADGLGLYEADLQQHADHVNVRQSLRTQPRRNAVVLSDGKSLHGRVWIRDHSPTYTLGSPDER